MKIILLVIVLSGCTSLVRKIDSVIVPEIAEANDNSVEAAIFGLCNGFSVGSIKRKFNTPEEMETYNNLCRTVPTDIEE